MSGQSILVTGASGFVGRALCAEMVTRGMIVRGITRSPCELSEGVERIVAGNFSNNIDRQNVLTDSSIVIHLAARVHVTDEVAGDPLSKFRQVNVQETLSLARQAAVAGTRRFLFISSIKVNGEATQLGHPFLADDEVAPSGAYGISKMEAEEGLLALSAETGMEVVIIRPPLVYGAGVKANFAAMMRWLQRGVPLPLGAIHNQRSLVALDNLIDLIITCVEHPAAAGQIFLVSDGEDVSTTELLNRMGQAMGHPARLIRAPATVLRLTAAIVGQQDVIHRLCNSLQIDMGKTRCMLGWDPPLTLDQGLKIAAKGMNT
jgi:nucleoside-diphosphate-sugar epimerase